MVIIHLYRIPHKFVNYSAKKKKFHALIGVTPSHPRNKKKNGKLSSIGEQNILTHIYIHTHTEW